MDLGSLLNGSGDGPTPPTPGMSDATQAAPPDQWMNWANDPVNRAGLLSFGLQMLSGGWGSGRAQVAQAIGAGAEGAAGAQAIQEKEADTTFNQNLETKKLDQAARLETQKEAGALERTKVLAGSRTDVANIRAQGGAMNKFEQQFYNTTYKEKAKQLSDQNFIATADQKLSNEEISAAAAAAAEEGVMSRRALYGPGSSPGLQAETPGAGSPGTTPPGSQTAVPGQGQGTAGLTYEQLKAKSGVDPKLFDQLAKTPQGKAFLQSKGVVAPE